MPNRRQLHPKPHLLVRLNPEYPSTKPRAINAHIIASGTFGRYEYYLHATKGWRRRRNW